jgi:hypothetical protein
MCGVRLRPLRSGYVRKRDCACTQIPQTAATGHCLTPAIEPPVRLPLRDPLPLNPAVHSAPLIGSFQFWRHAGGYSPVMLHAFAVNPASLARFAEMVGVFVCAFFTLRRQPLRLLLTATTPHRDLGATSKSAPAAFPETLCHCHGFCFRFSDECSFAHGALSPPL